LALEKNANVLLKTTLKDFKAFLYFKAKKKEKDQDSLIVI
jgi:hypothetical protein